LTQKTIFCIFHASKSKSLLFLSVAYRVRETPSRPEWKVPLEIKSIMEIGYEFLAIPGYRNLFPHYIFSLGVTATPIQKSLSAQNFKAIVNGKADGPIPGATK
jgi:hypothetical protein